MTKIDANTIERIRGLSIQDPLAARLLLACLVRSILEPAGQNAVVVGGTAVDTYVSGGLGTSQSLPAQWQESLDIDTVVIRPVGLGDIEQARNMLKKSGFELKKSSQSLLLPGVVFPVDLVGDWFPDDYSKDHVTTVHLEECNELGLPPALLAGPEDILFDYMESGWDTRHPQDWTRALAIAQVIGDALDLNYLFSKAHWRMRGQFVEPLERVLRGEPLRTDRSL